jgi:uncharacterized protein YeaO (DUF488 family)
MLFTKSILAIPSKRDGLRISVMSRHTLSDGVTPSARIQRSDIHMPILGPSPGLIGDYYKRGLPWGDFERRYLEEISDERKQRLVRWLGKLALETDVTLLCVERTSTHCHRSLLANACKAHIPELKIVHR